MGKIKPHFDIHYEECEYKYRLDLKTKWNVLLIQITDPAISIYKNWITDCALYTILENIFDFWLFWIKI